jgi:short-subunit dehydrogenase
MTTIAGKTVLLTGASRGLGAFLARALAREKATIVGVSRSQDSLEQVADAVQALGGKWIGIPFDISRVEQLPALISQIEQLASSIDILINNAGIEIYNNFQNYSTAEIQSVLNTNLLAAMELTRLVLPCRCGHIVNIASLAGKKGAPYNSIYSASKAGLIMWSDAIRQELVGTGVKISVVCPGYISGQGMTADTGVPIPKLSGTSTLAKTANATIAAIEKNQAEVIVNQDPVTEALTKLLLASQQIFPRFGDTVYRWMGVTKLNRMRIENRMEAKAKATTIGKLIK